jgi:hypothetical protein
LRFCVFSAKVEGFDAAFGHRTYTEKEKKSGIPFPEEKSTQQVLTEINI